MSLSFEELWKGIKCYPCSCVRPSVHPFVRPKFGFHTMTNKGCLFIFGSNLYDIKIPIKFDFRLLPPRLSYDPLQSFRGGGGPCPMEIFLVSSIVILTADVFVSESLTIIIAVVINIIL